jgi:hypothetical protein
VSPRWLDYASLSHEDAESEINQNGYMLAAIHRAFVDGDWMAVAYDKKGRRISAKGRNPLEAVCKLAWELRVRLDGKEGSTGRK